MLTKKQSKRGIGGMIMRLIDADAFDTKLFNDGFLGGLAACIGNTPRKRKFTIGEFRGMLAKAPTIDAVSVVRCCECKSYNKPRLGWCNFHLNRENPDDFCSYGERKGE